MILNFFVYDFQLSLLFYYESTTNYSNSVYLLNNTFIIIYNIKKYIFVI